jgi:hypothetical protein
MRIKGNAGYNYGYSGIVPEKYYHRHFYIYR